MLLQYQDRLESRQEPALQVNFRNSSGQNDGRSGDPVIAAGWRKEGLIRSTWMQKIEKCLLCVKHEISLHPCNAERRKGCAPASQRELFFVLQIGHEQAARLMRKTRVIDVEHAHAKAYFCSDRIQVGVERFFGDAEFGQSHRQDALLAPHENGQ